ncbi:hypothetical protein HaLaN_00345 [Haematococcus lacustris]|uniref:Uncharacterized protein n=1 Tax=Haematococcus lacustris TaxID=44745 RepID=A0A699YD88_HAELA|nr:hypothetical protein HaLaN_00345 [Haematococcus lacustris]
MAEAASVRQCAAWVLEAVEQAEAAHAKGLEATPAGSLVVRAEAEAAGVEGTPMGLTRPEATAREVDNGAGSREREGGQDGEEGQEGEEEVEEEEEVQEEETEGKGEAEVEEVEEEEGQEEETAGGLQEEDEVADSVACPVMQPLRRLRIWYTHVVMTGTLMAVAPLWLHLMRQHSLLRAALLWHQTSLLLLVKVTGGADSTGKEDAGGVEAPGRGSAVAPPEAAAQPDEGGTTVAPDLPAAAGQGDEEDDEEWKERERKWDAEGWRTDWHGDGVDDGESDNGVVDRWEARRRRLALAQKHWWKRWTEL